MCLLVLADGTHNFGDEGARKSEIIPESGRNPRSACRVALICGRGSRVLSACAGIKIEAAVGPLPTFVDDQCEERHGDASVRFDDFWSSNFFRSVSEASPGEAGVVESLDGVLNSDEGKVELVVVGLGDELGS